MNTQTNSTSDIYNASLEHSQQDIDLVIKLAGEEQQRRLNDTEGENTRRIIASQVSDLFSSSLRETWFHRGTSFVLSLLGTVKQSGKEVLNSQPIKTLNAKVQVAGQKSVAAAQDVSSTVANKAGVVGLKAQETALNIKEKSIETAQDIKAKSFGLAQGIKEKSVETAQDVSAKAQETAQDLKTKGIETAQGAKEKVQELASKLKFAVTNMKLYKKLNKSFSNLAENTNVAFALLEEENERAYRMSSPTQYWAIVNAMSCARLIKGIDTLYRPTSEPYAPYFARLLEETERNDRLQDSINALSNAKAVSLLISQKFSGPAPIPGIPAAKAEVVDEIKVVQKPLIATM